MVRHRLTVLMDVLQNLLLLTWGGDGCYFESGLCSVSLFSVTVQCSGWRRRRRRGTVEKMLYFSTLGTLYQCRAEQVTMVQMDYKILYTMRLCETIESLRRNV